MSPRPRSVRKATIRFRSASIREPSSRCMIQRQPAAERRKTEARYNTRVATGSVGGRVVNGSLGRGPTLGVAAAVALLLLNAGVSLLTIRQLREDSGRVAHTYEVLDAAKELLAAAGEAEVGHRT